MIPFSSRLYVWPIAKLIFRIDFNKYNEENFCSDASLLKPIALAIDNGYEKRFQVIFNPTEIMYYYSKSKNAQSTYRTCYKNINMQ